MSEKTKGMLIAVIIAVVHEVFKKVEHEAKKAVKEKLDSKKGVRPQWHCHA